MELYVKAQIVFIDWTDQLFIPVCLRDGSIDRTIYQTMPDAELFDVLALGSVTYELHIVQYERGGPGALDGKDVSSQKRRP